MTNANLLIVEDEQIVAMDLRSTLENGGYSVLGLADRGEVALQKAQELRPDLILMDIGLKGEMDGIDTAILVRERFNLPVIFLTAFADQATLERARLAEPFGYLLKPFDEGELFIAIEMALYKHSMESKLRESENKFRSVIANASDGIALADSDGRIIVWNTSLEQITGLNSSDLIGQSLWEINFQLMTQEIKTSVLLENQARPWEMSNQKNSAIPDKMEEREIQTAQGLRKTIQSNGFTVETSQERWVGVIVRDITERKHAELTILEARNQLEATLKAIPDLLFELGLDGRYYDYHSAHDELLAAPPEAFLGKMIYDVLPSDAAEVVQAGLEEANENGYSAGKQIKLQLPQGSVWFELSIARKANLSGQEARFIVMSRDITQRKQIEEALLVSEEQMRVHQIELQMQNEQLQTIQAKLEDSLARYWDLYELAPVGYLMVSETNIIIKANLTAEKLFGVGQGGLTQQTFTDFILPDDQDIYYLNNRQLVRTGATQSCEFRMQRNDRSHFWVKSEMSITTDSDNLTVYRIVLSDITNHKLAEEALRESRSLYHSLVETAPLSICRKDLEGRFTFANQHFLDLSQDTLANIVGKTDFDLHPSELAEKYQRDDKAVLASGKVLEQIEPRAILGSEPTIVHSIKVPIYDGNGKMNGIQISFWDVTERERAKEAERDQRLLAEALRDTSMALNSTLKLDDILDRILENIGKLVKYDVAMVLLVEGKTVEKIRYRGNFENGLSEQPFSDVRADMVNIPVMAEVIQSGNPYLIADIQADARWQVVAIPGMQDLHSLICVPIDIQGSVVGMINIFNAIPNFFTTVQTERTMAFASQAAVAIQNARLFERTQQLALTDVLTELYNMRYFNEISMIEFERSKRNGRPLCIMMMDIDHFKKINDTHGHGVGDLVLREIAARIKNAVRTIDIVARYGGEEFIILLPDTQLDEASQIAERVRLAVAQSPVHHKDTAISLTISLGVVELHQNVENVEELFRRADHVMYSAKAAGRNRVAVYSETGENKYGT